MYMIMMVVDDPNQVEAVIAAWEAAGAGGVTMVESTGIQRRRAKRRITLRFDYAQVAPCSEQGHQTLFAIVSDEATARACLAAAEGVVGDLDGPHTGVFAAWPLAFVKGVPGKAPDGKTGS